MVAEVDKPYVPPSCCVRDQYGDYLDQQKCQTWNQGPPGKNSGDENSAVYYRVWLVSVLKLYIIQTVVTAINTGFESSGSDSVL